jgi:hypothetical protein
LLLRQGIMHMDISRLIESLIETKNEETKQIWIFQNIT